MKCEVPPPKNYKPLKAICRKATPLALKNQNQFGKMELNNKHRLNRAQPAQPQPERNKGQPRLNHN